MLKTPRVNPRVRSNPSEFWKQHLPKAVSGHNERLRHFLGYAPGSGEDKDLSGADLSRSNLKGANLRFGVLTGADLRMADLHRADLSGTDLEGADLTRARLSGADLRFAALRGCTLEGADLHGADLRHARFDRSTNLNNVIVDRADFRGASGLNAEQKADFKRRGAIVD